MRCGVFAGIAGLCLSVAGHAARAQDQTRVNLAPDAKGGRGGVAMLAQAMDLYGLGQGQKDALTVLAAARLVGAVSLRMVTQKKTPEIATVAGAALPVQAGAMFAEARKLAGEDETLVGLIEGAEAEVAFGPLGVARVSPSTLASRGVDLWEIPLFGASYAELAVLGDGRSNLDVTVTDQNGNTVCLDVGATDRVFCDFTPAWNGYFTVRVENVGDGDNSYHLLMN